MAELRGDQSHWLRNPSLLASTIHSPRALVSIPREQPSTPIFSTCSMPGRTRDYASRASIARGQALFNSKPITISGVAGINDVAGLPASFSGTCGTCHDSPNVGNHSVSAPLNIGVADVTSPLDVSYLPVFTLVNNTTGETVQTTDPGRALITGKWADIGKVKGPILRGLASRAPYFHNGSAATLADVLVFYDMRFNIGFTPRRKLI